MLTRASQFWVRNTIISFKSFLRTLFCHRLHGKSHSSVFKYEKFEVILFFEVYDDIYDFSLKKQI